VLGASAAALALVIWALTSLADRSRARSAGRLEPAGDRTS
jgi:hypothetical protein